MLARGYIVGCHCEMFRILQILMVANLTSKGVLQMYDKIGQFLGLLAGLEWNAYDEITYTRFSSFLLILVLRAEFLIKILAQK